MNDIIVDIDEVCGDKIYTRDDGHILYNMIDNLLNSNANVIVNFKEREIASESFLDEAIVEHYLRPQHENVISRIVLRGVSKSDQILLKKIFEYRKRLEDKETKKAIKAAKMKQVKDFHYKKNS